MPLKVMNEIQEDELESENKDDGGETGEQETTETNEDPKDYKKIAEDQRKRAEKAEKDLKAKLAEKPPVEQPKTPEVQKTNEVVLTPMDAILLGKANITEADDIEEVVKFANYVGKPVKDVLKDKTMQTILRTRQEERATAEATNTGNARRGSSKVSDEQILADVNEGKFPTDPEALAKARHMAKFKK